MATPVGEAGEELGDIRASLQRTAQLSEIGRRLGLGHSSAPGRGPSTLEWSEYGNRKMQLQDLKAQVAQLTRLSRGQTAVPLRPSHPAQREVPKPVPVAAVGQGTAQEERNEPAASGITPVKGPKEEPDSEQLNSKIERLIFELGSLSPRILSSPVSGGGHGDDALPATGRPASPSKVIRKQVHQLDKRQQAAAKRTADLQAATAGLEKMWTQPDVLSAHALETKVDLGRLDHKAATSWAERQAQRAIEKDSLRRAASLLAERAKSNLEPGQCRLSQHEPSATHGLGHGSSSAQQGEVSAAALPAVDTSPQVKEGEVAAAFGSDGTTAADGTVPVRGGTADQGRALIEQIEQRRMQRQEKQQQQQQGRRPRVAPGSKLAPGGYGTGSLCVPSVQQQLEAGGQGAPAARSPTHMARTHAAARATPVTAPTAVAAGSCCTPIGSTARATLIPSSAPGAYVAPATACTDGRRRQPRQLQTGGEEAGRHRIAPASKATLHARETALVASEETARAAAATTETIAANLGGSEPESGADRAPQKAPPPQQPQHPQKTAEKPQLSLPPHAEDGADGSIALRGIRSPCGRIEEVSASDVGTMRPASPASPVSATVESPGGDGSSGIAGALTDRQPLDLSFVSSGSLSGTEVGESSPSSRYEGIAVLPLKKRAAYQSRTSLPGADSDVTRPRAAARAACTLNSGASYAPALRPRRAQKDSARHQQKQPLRDLHESPQAAPPTAHVAVAPVVTVIETGTAASTTVTESGCESASAGSSANGNGNGSDAGDDTQIDDSDLTGALASLRAKMSPASAASLCMPAETRAAVMARAAALLQQRRSSAQKGTSKPTEPSEATEQGEEDELGVAEEGQPLWQTAGHTSRASSPVPMQPSATLDRACVPASTRPVSAPLPSSGRDDHDADESMERDMLADLDSLELPSPNHYPSFSPAPHHHHKSAAAAAAAVAVTALPQGHDRQVEAELDALLNAGPAWIQRQAVPSNRLASKPASPPAVPSTAPRAAISPPSQPSRNPVAFNGAPRTLSPPVAAAAEQPPAGTGAIGSPWGACVAATARAAPSGGALAKLKNPFSPPAKARPREMDRLTTPDSPFNASHDHDAMAGLRRILGGGDDDDDDDDDDDKEEGESLPLHLLRPQQFSPVVEVSALEISSRSLELQLAASTASPSSPSSPSPTSERDSSDRALLRAHDGVEDAGLACLLGSASAEKSVGARLREATARRWSDVGSPVVMVTPRQPHAEAAARLARGGASEEESSPTSDALRQLARTASIASPSPRRRQRQQSELAGVGGPTDDAHLLKLMSCSSWSNVLAAVTPSNPREKRPAADASTFRSFRPLELDIAVDVAADAGAAPPRSPRSPRQQKRHLGISTKAPHLSPRPLNGKTRAALGGLGFSSPRVNAQYVGRQQYPWEANKAI